MASSVEVQLLNVFGFVLQLLVVMDRIRSFPLSSPLSKFLNGLEILLAKAQVRRSLRLSSFFSLYFLTYIWYHVTDTVHESCLSGFGEVNLLHAESLKSENPAIQSNAMSFSRQ